MHNKLWIHSAIFIRGMIIIISTQIFLATVNLALWKKHHHARSLFRHRFSLCLPKCNSNSITRLKINISRSAMKSLTILDIGMAWKLNPHFLVPGWTHQSSLSYLLKSSWIAWTQIWATISDISQVTISYYLEKSLRSRFLICAFNNSRRLLDYDWPWWRHIACISEFMERDQIFVSDGGNFCDQFTCRCCKNICGYLNCYYSRWSWTCSTYPERKSIFYQIFWRHLRIDIARRCWEIAESPDYMFSRSRLLKSMT